MWRVRSKQNTESPRSSAKLTWSSWISNCRWFSRVQPRNRVINRSVGRITIHRTKKASTISFWYAKLTIRLEPSARAYLGTSKRKNFMTIEPSTPYTGAKLGGAERSGGVVKETRLIQWQLQQISLANSKWPEMSRAAVYLHNRTPEIHLQLEITLWRIPHSS
jgi:hypothetical protein